MPQTLSLPDLDALDPAALKAMILDQHAHAGVQQEQYRATLNSRASEIERLALLVEKLQRMLFGTKSEKVLRQIDQLELQLEELQAASAVKEMRATAPEDKPAPAKPFRRPLPEHLPREIHTHMPDAARRRARPRKLSFADRMLAWNGPHVSTPCSVQPNSTASTQNSIFTTSSIASPNIPSIASTNFCHGKSRSTQSHRIKVRYLHGRRLRWP